MSCDYHDAAAALVVDGEVVAAVEEERISRRKHDQRLPQGAVASCLAIGGLDPDDLDAVVFHEKPLNVVSRVIAARQRRGPAAIGAFARDMPVLLRDNLMISYRIGNLFRDLGASRRPAISFCEHHLSHAAAAFLPSPFETAAVVTVDGIGEWATTTVGHGVHGRIDLLEEQRFPHSLGLLYSLVTLWCGFEPNDGEYKVMGLAPRGRPTYRDALDELVHVDDDGGIRADGRAVRWWSGDLRGRRRLHDLLGGPPRRPDEPIERRHEDLAASVQELTEVALERMVAHAARRTDESRVCLAGGVALNCVATGRLARSADCEGVWVQPAAGDAGSALGAALWYEHEVGDRPRRPRSRPTLGGRPGDALAGAALGPRFDAAETEQWLAGSGTPFRRFDDVDELVGLVADRLADGAIVGWFQGRMEFGPRALGHRSILADPRGDTTRDDLNRRVKGRESFRPFAPSVTWEAATDWFELDHPSPYMSFVVAVRDPTALPACTHVDGTARVQTVHRELDERFWSLLQAFGERTGCPVLLNTSFNRAGEPIVCTPDEALRTARSAGLDLLVIENHVIQLAGDLR